MTSVESLVQKRREELKDPGIPAGSSEIWGLALSGGGIRSATFCLGLLRSLAENGALRRFDVMSTVSGGGYVGSMLGKMLHQAKSKAEVEDVYKALGAAETRWFTWWLRANGRYLIPRGVRDRFFVAALFIRNLIGIHAEVAVATLCACAVLGLFNLAVWQTMSVQFGVTLRWFTPDVLSWMPTLWLLAVFPAFFSVVSCCIYWAVPTALDMKAAARRGMIAFWVVVVLALAYIHPRGSADSRLGWPDDSWVLWAALLVLGAAWIVALLQVPRLVAAAREELAKTGGQVSDDHLKGVLRNQVTETLVNRVAWAFGILVAGLVERLGWFVAFELSGYQGWYGAALLFVAAVLRMVLPKVAPASGTTKPVVGVPLTWIGQLLGWLLAVALLVWWVSLGYAVIFDGFAPGTLSSALESAYRALLMVLLSGLYIAITSRNVGFLNSSSLHSFYRARLTRSFLGAANDSRVVQQPQPGTQPPAQPAGVNPAQASALASLPDEPTGGHQTHSVSDVLGDDDVPMEAYAPHAHGGLVHLLNICLNETKDCRGGLFNQDRRGQPFTLGPGGAARIGQRPWSKLESAGSMTLGTWMAVSGAALAPGLGSMTRPGLSALIALTGMRLGFWWDNNAYGEASVQVKTRGFPPKTRVLANEILGRFGLGYRDWYLSDGGHFENTGAYALLSSRAKLIVLADCGADPLYRFADLENLIRKARVDLGAEITFMRPKGPRPDPKLAAFGSLSDLKLDSSPACLALAKVRYRPEPGMPDEGVMVIVKPNVSLDLPVDLHNFKADFPEFPQQSTTDQFFSEAQWESYFVLGKVIGSKLGRGVLEDISDVAAKCFELDNGQTLGGAAADKADKAKQGDKGAAATSARLPTRLAGTSVAAASLSVGAAASLVVATWQAIDSARTAQAAKVSQDRAVLKELSDNFGRLGAPPSPDAALPAVASTLLRIGDVHCKAEDVAWFHASPAAVCTLRSALELCGTRRTRMPSCELLLSSTGTSCLDPEKRVSNYVPKYWAVELHRPGPITCPTLEADPWVVPAPVKAEAAAAAASAASAAELAASAARSVELAAAKLSAPNMSRQQSERAAAEVRLAAQQAAAAASAAADSMNKASVAQTSTAASAPAGGERGAGACAGFTVYTQIYGGKQRDLVRGLREPWRSIGASVPPIDDVYARATRENRKLPRPYAVTTVLFPTEESRTCADALATKGQDYTGTLKTEVSKPGEVKPEPSWEVKRLSPSLQPSAKVIEVWVAPTWAEGAVATTGSR